MDGPQNENSAGHAASHSAHGPLAVKQEAISGSRVIQVHVSAAPSNPSVMGVDVALFYHNREVPLIPPRFEHVVIKVNNHSSIHLSCSLLNRIFCHIKRLIVDLDTVVPSYISDNDLLSYLASFVYDPAEPAEMEPGFIGPLPLPGPLVTYPITDDEDDSVVELSSPPVRSTPRKRRQRLMKEPLNDAFLRRSTRLLQSQGYKDDVSEEKKTTNPPVYVAHPGDASAIAPHLTIDNMQGIATGYLKMQPRAVSAATLLELDDDG